jgi:hypothetical protein
MPKSRRRKRKPVKKREAPFLTVNRGFGVPPEVMREAMAVQSRQAETEFPEKVACIEGQLGSVHPPSLLAIVASYGLQAFVGKGDVEATNALGASFNQHHVEIFQALMLRKREDEWGHDPPMPDDTPKAAEALIAASDAHMLKRFPKETGLSNEELLLRSVQEKLRINTQAVRNWGHYSQVLQHSRELYSALDPVWIKHFGLPFNSIIDVMVRVAKRLDEQADARIQMLVNVKRGGTTRKMIERYYAASPHLVGAPEDLGAMMDGVPPMQVFAMILAHTDLHLVSHYTTNVAELAKELNLPVDAVEKVFDAFSLKPGDLAANNLEHLWLDNPVWTKPFVRLSDGEIFSATPHAFFSHIHKIVERFAASVGAQKEFSDARAKFLEDKLTATVKKGLPTAKHTPTFKWRVGPTQYETDHVAVIDLTVVIFEAKSGILTDQGLRGAPDRARRHVQDLIVDPSMQSARLKEMIEGQGVDPAKRAVIMKALGLREDVAYKVTRVSVSLEEFGPLATCEKELKEVGWIEADHNLAPSMTLASLECVFDILEEDYLILHYPDGRSPIQKHFDLHADELDLLAFYLETGFCIHNVRRADIDGLVIGGASKPIDNYYNCLDAGEPAKKPKLGLPALWRSTLNAVRAKGFKGWTRATHALLSCGSPAELRSFAAKFEKMRDRLPRRGKDPKHKFVGTILPPHSNATAICLFAYHTAERAGRGDAAMELSAQCYAEDNINECWLFGFDVDQGNRLDRTGSTRRERKELAEVEDDFVSSRQRKAT